MRVFVHDQVINFRINSEWLSDVQALADRLGVTVSELLRRAIYDTVERGGPVGGPLKPGPSWITRYPECPAANGQQA